MKHRRWKRILELQDKMHPGWRHNDSIYPITLYTTGLASEVGEICDNVIHMNNGGSQVYDNSKWNCINLLHEVVDSYVMLVLISAKMGFTERDFNEAWGNIEKKLEDRVKQRENKI